MRAKLINLGRGKVNQDVNFKTWRGLEREIFRHLMSRNVFITTKPGSKKGTIIAGVHPVGEIELIDCFFPFAFKELGIVSDK